MSSIALKITDVSKTFTELHHKPLVVLQNINLTIHDGEFFLLLGPSGSGKSTLLRIMSGLEKSYKGKVDLREGLHQSDMSFVFQQFALLPWLTVSENIALGLHAQHLPETEVQSRIHRELSRLNLAKFAHSYPRDLSGGMKQRVGIARALATNPKIIFMDEPFSELDSFTAEDLRKDLMRIWSEQKITIIMVSHIISEAIELGDRIGVMTSRPGTISKIIENTLSRPRDKRSLDFFAMEDELYKLIRP